MIVNSAYFIFLTYGLATNVFEATALENYFCERGRCRNLDSRICTKNMLWTVTQIRKSQCFLKCLSEECKSVFYNDFTQKCQGHSSFLNGVDDCRDEEGTKYYQKCTGKGPMNCKEVQCSGQNTTGIYTIYPADGSNGFSVRCDMDTEGGGWTVFQRRVNGSVDFYRTWADYKSGFGNLNTEFWLSLDYIHKLTSQENTTLRVDLITPGPPIHSSYALYSVFKVGDEKSSYGLKISGYSGVAGDSMYLHNGNKFSTRDKDNDLVGYSCAKTFFGGWWYNYCHQSNLNGLYGSVKFGEGIIWSTLSNFYVSMTFVEMKLK
ncbi:hypothetical protein CHS0354_000061 [Potamilus streckersoni]|uniref:Fibrinogen C-terminal domain-containing protein n=1 Tax=Potamilus streckersoni TaxID=2493646 RepID=A0AAE0RU72_9BIVA|nr:hypothetical protein CHS0354_000061 [Potamilus streckersoni]